MLVKVESQNMRLKNLKVIKDMPVLESKKSKEYEDI